MKLDLLQLLRLISGRAAAPLFLATLALARSAPGLADSVACHVIYGGETRTLQTQAVASPYTVEAVEVGSFFLLRIVFQDEPKDQAAIKTYVYAHREGEHGPFPLHQAIFPYPPTTAPTAPIATRYGFSGLHFVHEPQRDGELQYWCEMKP